MFLIMHFKWLLKNMWYLLIVKVIINKNINYNFKIFSINYNKFFEILLQNLVKIYYKLLSKYYKLLTKLFFYILSFRGG